MDQYPKIGTEFPLDPPPGWVQSVIEAGRALILIDGIDEIPKAERSQIRKALEGFCRLDKGNYVVLTTRPGIIDDEWFRDIDVMHAEVNPLSELERGELIEQWHKAAAEQLTLLERPDDASELAPVLIEQLRTAPHVAQLGTNPLLCAAICALHYSKQGYLPKRQADLCHHLCQLLIHQRDLQRSLAETKDTSDYGLLEYDHKESLIRTMAQAILRTGNAAIEREEADALIGEKLPHLGLRKSLDATFVRERLVERTGLLREAYGGAIDFAHNTLRDFLAGQAFANESLGHKELAQHVNEESWQRPIVFAAGAGTRDFAERLVRALLSRGSRMCRILAQLCDASVTELDAGLRERIRETRDQIFPPKTRDEAALLATLGDPIVELLTHPDASERVATACARALRLIGTDSAKSALRRYMATDHEEVAEELAAVFNPLEAPFWRSWVQIKGLPEGIARQVDDLGPLSGLSGLQDLVLDGTQVSDLGPLSGLSGLQDLRLNGAQVSDLGPLSGLSGLRDLWFEGTQVSDLGPVEGIAGLTIYGGPRTDRGG